MRCCARVGGEEGGEAEEGRHKEGGEREDGDDGRRAHWLLGREPLWDRKRGAVGRDGIEVYVVLKTTIEPERPKVGK